MQQVRSADRQLDGVGERLDARIGSASPSDRIARHLLQPRCVETVLVRPDVDLVGSVRLRDGHDPSGRLHHLTEERRAAACDVDEEDELGLRVADHLRQPVERLAWDEDQLAGVFEIGEPDEGAVLRLPEVLVLLAGHSEEGVPVGYRDERYVFVVDDELRVLEAIVCADEVVHGIRLEEIELVDELHVEYLITICLQRYAFNRTQHMDQHDKH